MNKRIKQKWVEALRSDEFEQGLDYLHTKDYETGVDKYCCLGVLCQIAVRENVIPGPEFDETGELFCYGEDSEVAHLPDEVITWAELECENPELPDGKLSDLNDNRVSFATIATLIDRNL